MSFLYKDEIFDWSNGQSKNQIIFKVCDQATGQARHQKIEDAFYQ